MLINKDALEFLLNRASANAFSIISDAEAAAPLAVQQHGYEVRSLEKYLPAPTRIQQTVNLTSPSGFVEYVKAFKDKNTVVFVGDRSFNASLDYHAKGSPSWCDHTANYEPKHSHQWGAWSGGNKQVLNQTEFALFIEARLDDIIKPAPATVLTAVLNFREAADHTIASSQKLETGEINFQFVKENKTQTTRFPHELTIRLPIFDHHPEVDVDLHVRYRVEGNGVLRIWYQFKRDPIDIVRQHFEQVSEGIQKDLATVPFFEGAAVPRKEAKI